MKSIMTNKYLHPFCKLAYILKDEGADKNEIKEKLISMEDDLSHNKVACRKAVSGEPVQRPIKLRNSK